MKKLTILAFIFMTTTVMADIKVLEYSCKGAKSEFTVIVTENLTLNIGNPLFDTPKGPTAVVDGVEGKLMSVDCKEVASKFRSYGSENCIANDDIMFSYFGSLRENPTMAMVHTVRGYATCYLSSEWH